MAVGRLVLKKTGYDFPPYRPPSEADSLLVRVTRGCPWNKCTFCSMYKHLCFEKRPLDDIFRDIASARESYSDVVGSVFIADSNSLVVSPDDMTAVLERLYASFPYLQRVTTYARARTLNGMSAVTLRRLRAAGLTRLHVGLETGSAGLLHSIRKGITPDGAVAAGRKACAAGFELSLYVLLGIGGEERSAEHAVESAAVLNRIDPHFIRVRTLLPQPGSDIYRDMQSGVFVKASHETILHEQYTLISKLRVTSHYLSDHITNYVPVNGILPDDRDAMLGMLEHALVSLEDPAVRERFVRRDSRNRL